MDFLAKSLQQWGMKGSRESKGFEMIKVLAKMQERDIIYSRGCRPGPPLLSQGLPPPDPRFLPRGCRPRTPTSFPGAAAPGPPLLSQGLLPPDPLMRLRATATGRHWSPLVATWNPKSPKLPGRSSSKWRPVASSGDQWRPVEPVLGSRLYAYAPSTGRHRSPLVAPGRHLESQVPQGARKV